MRVPPGADLRVEAEVFVAHIVPADEADAPVHDHDLAVVAEVDLETVGWSFRGVERGDLHPGGAQLGAVAAQPAAPDFVEKHHAPHPGPRPLDERVAQPAPESVLVDDVELHEHVFLRGGDAGEDGGEGGLAVDEEFGAVVRGEGELRQPFEEQLLLPPGFRLHALAVEFLGEFPRDGARLQHLRAPRRDVAREFCPPEDPIRGDRDPRQREERHRPRDRALGRACFHDGFHRGEKAGHLGGEDDAAEQGGGGHARAAT